jgi:predicted nucleic acid-binding protein
MSPRYHLDANVVLRFLRNDDTNQSPAAARLFASAKAGKVRLTISAVTVAEAFYVLSRVYKHTKADAAAKLLPLMQSDVLEVDNRPRVLDALQRVTKANVDFGDGYLASTAVEHGDGIASFDEDLQSFTDVATVLPT